MKKKKIFLAIGLIALSLTLCAWVRWRPAKRFEYIEPQINELRVVTWNVGYFAPVSNKNLKDVDLEVISSLLKEIKSNIIVLQELGNTEQADYIVNRLGENWSCYSALTGHGDQVISILSNIELDSRELVLCGGRNSIGATLKTNNGKSLYILGVHSPHPARGLDENVENITCAIEHTSNRDEDIKIIAGDMNSNFDTNTKSALYSKILEEYGDGTFHLGETYYARTRIDHMFHVPQDLEISETGSGIIDLPMRMAKVPGFRDHRPIVVTYRLY